MDDHIPLGEMTDDTTDWVALARYLSGESSPAEAARMRDWLQADPARQQMSESLRDAFARIPGHHTPPQLDVDGALRRVHARMREQPAGVIPLARRPRAWSFLPTSLLRAAAVVAVLVAGALLLRQLRSPSSSPALARDFRTGVGEVDTVRLGDGSRVILGPGSHLEIGTTDRFARLAGTAFFEVRHDDARPFRVEAGGARIEDLGTSFGVHAPTRGEVRVAVTEGIVRLRSAEVRGDSGVVLREGELGVAGAASRAVRETGGPVSEALAWMEGRLVFREAPLAEVAAEVRRWYGIELEVDPALANRHLTVSFDGETPEEVVRVLEAVLGATAEARGDTVTLSPGKLP